MGLSYSEVADIVKIIDSSSCDEVILEQGDLKLVIRRGHPPRSEARATVTPAAASSPSTQPATTQAFQPAKAAPSENAICAPMVGTFYARPSPDAPPFVEKGTPVTKGMPLCIIEVMKLFTTVEAARDGVISDVLVEDGQLVEFDQPLFLIG